MRDLSRLNEFLGDFQLEKHSQASVFERIMRARFWPSDETVSGEGSTVAKTIVLRKRLAEAFALLGIRSLVDAPCGDLNWMRLMDYNFESYIGIDIVSPLIERLRNEKEKPDSTRHFQVGDVTTDILPFADAILCRDCLVHLPFSEIHNAHMLFKKAGFRYLFVTTFPNRKTNDDCAVGAWRPLNMEIEPLNWGKPIMILKEDHEPPYEDKSIGVWSLTDSKNSLRSLFRSWIK
jgi:hypothetical protein